MPRRSFDMGERLVFDYAITIDYSDSATELYIWIFPEIITYVQMRRRRISGAFFELSGGGHYLWYVNSWFLAVHFLMKNWCVAFQLRREICLICLPVPTSLCRICTILGTSMNSNGASVVIPLPTLTVVTVSASSTPSMSVMLVLWENIRDYGLWLYQLLLRW